MGSDSPHAPHLKPVPYHAERDSGPSAAQQAPADRLVALGPADTPGTWDAAVRGLLRSNQELEAIAVALSAPFDDLKAQAVSLLAKRLETAAHRKPDGTQAFEPASIRMLQRLLSDPTPAIRAEAKRVALSLNVGGTEEKTLRLLLSSRFPDVRSHVLEVLEARQDELWAYDLTMEMVDDPDALLRAGAFGLAGQRAAGRGVQHLSWALSGPHTGLKILAVEEIGGRAGEAVEVLLTRALRDSDAAVRRAAIEVASSKGAQPLLVEALESVHDDTRLRAAHALARLGALEALDLLLAQLSMPCPEGDAHSAWVEHMRLALDGVAELGDQAALPAVRAIAEQPIPELHCDALRAFVQVCDEDDADALALVRQSLSSSSSRAKREAAIGLALLGSDECCSELASEGQQSEAQALDAVAHSAALASKRPELLAAFADHESAAVRGLAALLTLLAHPPGTDGVFRWRLAMLSCGHEDTRALGARALAHALSPQQAEQHLHAVLTERGESSVPCALSLETTHALGALVAHGPPRLRARAARLVRTLLEDPALFDRAWKQFSARFSPSLGEALARMNRREIEWGRRVERAFTAEVVPNAGSPLKSVPRRSAAAFRTGASRIVHIAAAIPEVARPLLCVAYGDAAYAVREAAIEALGVLGVDAGSCGLADHAALGRALRSLPSAADVPLFAPAPEPIALKQGPPTQPSPRLAPPVGNPPAPPPSQVPSKAPAPPVPAVVAPEVLQPSSLPPPNVLERGRVRAGVQHDSRAVRLAGDVGARGAVCDIVAFLGQSGWRGELCVVDQGHVRTLFFDAGNVVGASSTAPGDRLGDVMVHFGAIDEAQQRQIESLLEAGKRFGQIAVQLQFVTEDRLFDLMAKQICRIVFAVFAASDGEFYFYDGFDDTKLPTRHTLGATQLLMQGLSQQDEAELYRLKIQSPDHIPDALPDRKPPPASLKRVYDLVDGKRSVALIGRETGLGEFEVTKQLYELLQSKHVRMLEPPELSAGMKRRLAAAQALQFIREELGRASNDADLRQVLLRSAAGQTMNRLGFTLADNCSLEFSMPESRTGMDETPSRRGEELSVLHELVAAALLVAEGQLGATGESQLRAALTPQLNILRPHGQTLAAQGEGLVDSTGAPSQRFHIRMLGDAISRPPKGS